MTKLIIPELAPWSRAQSCTGSVTPGARALMAYYLEQTPDIAHSLGIYNCRTVRGGSTTSLHGEGRACDLGNPPTAAGKAMQYEFLTRLAPHAKRLGIQLVIFDRTLWSAVRRPEGERYNGVHPHTDHAHVELTWEAARRLTLATLRAVAGESRGATSTPTSTPSSKGVLAMLPTLDLRKVKRGHSTTYLRAPKAHILSLQGLLTARGAYSGRVDGIAGPVTKQAVGALQKRTNTGNGRGGADYIVGENTWKAAHALKV